VLTGQVTTENGIYETGYENLFLIPADRGLFKVSDYLSSSGTGAFILKLRLKSVANCVLIPVEANVKGMNSLIDTLDFLQEQSNLTAFTGKILGIIPFRDRWVGNTQTLEGRQNIEAMKEFAGDIPILASIRESEKFKSAIRQGKLLSEMGQTGLQYPFEQIVEALGYE
jgi:chromosome partitioning protein